MNSPSENKSAFSEKIWKAAAIILLVVTLALLFKTLFSLLLLVLGGVLICIYFHACAGFLKQKLKLGSPYALILSVALNLIVLTLFFWFVGARLNSQIDELANTLPETWQKAKSWLAQRPGGEKGTALFYEFLRCR